MIISYVINKKIKKLFFVMLLISPFISFGSTNCTSSKVIASQALYFYGHFLNKYTVNLTATLSAIKNGEAGSGAPFYKRPWSNPCPLGIHSATSCVEYTVYPSDQNFSPPGIMKKIEQYTGGIPYRGSVRIITNTASTQYVYTVDHEATFCGPYSL